MIAAIIANFEITNFFMRLQNFMICTSNYWSQYVIGNNFKPPIISLSKKKFVKLLFVKLVIFIYWKFLIHLNRRPRGKCHWIPRTLDITLNSAVDCKNNYLGAGCFWFVKYLDNCVLQGLFNFINADKRYHLLMKFLPYI